MAGPGDPPRYLPRLSPTYTSKPMDALFTWLDNNTNSLRGLTEDQIVQRARGALGPSVSVLNNGDIAAAVKSWAKSQGITLADGPGPAIPRAGDPAVVANLKKLLGSIPTSVTWVGCQGSLGISVSGATATLNQGNTQVSLNASFSGLKLETQTSGMTFGATIGAKDWNLTFTFGRVIPNIPDMATVFKNGSSAVSGVLSNLGQIDPRDPNKTKQAFSPYLDPIKQSIDSAARIAKARPGDISVGAWIQGGMPGGPPGGGPPTVGGLPPSNSGGVTVGVGLTIVF
jgi:hypothetical protein